MAIEDHAGQAADHLLALVVAVDSSFRVTPELRRATAALISSLAVVLANTRRGGHQ